MAGLGIYAENGNIYSRLDLDFNNDTHEDASDLAALGQVIGGAVCDTATQRCDNPDFNRDGEVNADDFTAFGQAMAGTYRVFATDITDYRFLYRGYWYDKHLGIYHVRHRAYDPAIQRWLQPDPAMFIDGMNVYAYCGNEPFAMYDPMGLWGENWGTSVANGGGGVGLGTAVEWAVGLGNAYTDNLAASITDPSGVTRAAEGVVHAVIAGVNAEKNNAAHGAYSSNAVDYAVSIAGQLTGTNKIAAGATGYLAAEDRLVSGVERAGLFFEGLSEAILTVAGGGKGGGNRAGIPQGTKALERIEPAAPVVELHRPYLRKATRQEIERRAVKDADGRYLDPNTGLPIQGKPDIGHIWGFEHRRLVKIAQQKGMTQKQFNDWVNSHPEWFQFECPRSNRSHKYEKPGND
ncbi:MAG: GH-E family nuclease [Phycisphaerae bacterium]